MVVREEISNFAQNTSVKGVSRLFRADTIEIRLLWSFAIIVCLIIGCLHSASVFNDFLAFSPMTQIKAHSPRTQTFPNLLVCNLNPFVWLKDLPENETYSFYLEMVQNKMKCDNCSANEVEYLEIIREEQLTIARYEGFVVVVVVVFKFFVVTSHHFVKPLVPLVLDFI